MDHAFNIKELGNLQLLNVVYTAPKMELKVTYPQSINGKYTIHSICMYMEYFAYIYLTTPRECSLLIGQSSLVIALINYVIDHSDQ